MCKSSLGVCSLSTVYSHISGSINATVTMTMLTCCCLAGVMLIMFTILVWHVGMLACLHLLISTKEKVQLRLLRMSFVLHIFGSIGPIKSLI